MPPGKQARQKLRGQWPGVVAAEAVILAARLALLIVQFSLLRLSGFLPWMTAGVWAAMLLVDWLLLSPLLLGREFLYLDVVQGRPATARRLTAGFGTTYGKALRWRLGRFWRRLAWSGLCYAPAAAALGLIRALRVRPPGPTADTLLLLCVLCVPALLLGGFMLCEARMLRYQPAGCLLAASDGRLAVKGLFGRARRITRGRTGELLGLSGRYAPLRLTCLLAVPCLFVCPLFQTARLTVVRQYMLDDRTEVRPAKEKKPRRPRREKRRGLPEETPAAAPVPPQ